jgi:hypothetical protein
MNGMVLHCGAKLVDREQILNVPVSVPATDTYIPVSHGHVLELVENALSNSGLKVEQSAFALAREGARFFGLLQVRPVADSKLVEARQDVSGVESRPGWTGVDFQAGEGAGPDKDYAYMVAIRNSLDKSFPASMGAGNRVFVCDNLSMSAEVMLSRRHTLNILRDLPMLVCKGIAALQSGWRSMDQRIDLYKQAELSDDSAARLLLEAAKVQAIRKIDVLPAFQEWESPRHPEFANNGKTVWRLMNAVTEVSKEASLIEMPGRTMRLQAKLDNFIGFQAPQVIDAEAVMTGSFDPVPALA